MARRTTDFPESERAGWRVRSWVAAVGISRSKMYALPRDLQPESVAIGAGIRLITEQPADWIARVGRRNDGPLRVIARPGLPRREQKKLSKEPANETRSPLRTDPRNR